MTYEDEAHRIPDTELMGFFFSALSRDIVYFRSFNRTTCVIILENKQQKMIRQLTVHISILEVASGC